MAVLFGSLIYIFANYQTYAAVKHPYFINPMIYLPLLLLGIDKIYKKEKPYLFMGMTSIAALSNFYFFYMLCIFMFLYAAFRYFVVIDKRSVKNVFSWFFKFLGYFMTGVLLAMPVLFPVLATFFGSERSGVSNDIPLLYKESYYRNFLGYVNSGAQEGPYWIRLGFAAFAVMAALLLISRKKKKEEKALLGGLVLLLLFCMLPAAAHMMNGFSYPANRWTWAFAMLMAYIFVVEYPVFRELGKKEKIKICGGCNCLYSAVLYHTQGEDEQHGCGSFSRSCLCHDIVLPHDYSIRGALASAGRGLHSGQFKRKPVWAVCTGISGCGYVC